MITEEKAIDNIYDINCVSTINQLMFKIMKSEALLKECEGRIETQLGYFNETHIFFSITKIKHRILFLNTVCARIKNYRYNKMLELQGYIENTLPIDHKF